MSLVVINSVATSSLHCNYNLVTISTKNTVIPIIRYYLPIITAMLFTSFCATAIVGTLVARLNG